MSWLKIKEFFKKLNFASKVLKFIKAPIPYLAQFQAFLAALVTIIDQIMKKIVKKNEEKTEQTNQSTEQAGNAMEEERRKPLPEQNNDVLREEARKRHNGK